MNREQKAEWDALCAEQFARESHSLKKLSREHLEAAHLMMLYALRNITDSRYGKFASDLHHAEHCMSAASEVLYKLGDKEFGGWREFGNADDAGMSAQWTWAGATPQERGEWVRLHWGHCRRDEEALAKLFNLTAQGVRNILHGDDWKPEYSRDTDQ